MAEHAAEADAARGPKQIQIGVARKAPTPICLFYSELTDPGVHQAQPGCRSIFQGLESL